MSYKKLILVFSYLCFLASCNLQPVYSKKYGSQISDQLSAIDIEPLKSIDGAEFEYYLSSILPKIATVKAKYLLKVKFTNVKLPSTIQKNSYVLRETVSQIVEYSLFDIMTGKKINSGKFRHIASYKIFSSPYDSYIEDELALEDLTRQSANGIRDRLILYFKKKASSV